MATDKLTSFVTSICYQEKRARAHIIKHIDIEEINEAIWFGNNITVMDATIVPMTMPTSTSLQWCL